MIDDRVQNSASMGRASRRRSRRWILIAGGALTIIAVSYVHFFLYLPIGSGPAGPDVEQQPFSQPWTDRKVLLVGIGDSVTAGFGATKGQAYFARLIANPPSEFPDMQGKCLSLVLPNLETLNLAVSGSNSLQHVSHIRDRLP